LAEWLADGGPLDGVRDVYGERVVDRLRPLLGDDPDEQSEAVYWVGAGMFHQESAERGLPLTFPPLLLACALDTVAEEPRRAAVNLMCLVASQGLGLAGIAGHAPLRLGFFPSGEPSPPIVELACRDALRADPGLASAVLRAMPAADALLRLEFAQHALLLDAVAGLLTDPAAFGGEEELPAVLARAAIGDRERGTALSLAASGWPADATALARGLLGVATPADLDRLDALAALDPLPDGDWASTPAFALLALARSASGWRAVVPRLAEHRRRYAPVEARAAELDAEAAERWARDPEILDIERLWHAKVDLGWREWPVHDTVAEWLVLEALRPHLGRGTPLPDDALDADQAALLDALHAVDLWTYAEIGAGRPHTAEFA